MKAKRKWLFAAIAVALAVAGAIALPFLVDEAPPDDADLRLTPVEIPHEENGFHVLDLKIDDIRWPDGASTRDGRKLLRDLALGNEWDPAAAGAILDKNAEVLTKLDASLRRPRFQVPEGAPEVPWMGIGHLALIRMRALLVEGKSREALDQAWGVTTLGQKLQGSSGRLIEFSMGKSLEKAGLSKLRSISRRDDLDRDLVLPLARRLQSFSSRKAAEFLWKRWYEFERSWLDPAIESGAIKSLAADIPSIWRNDLCLKPNQTRRLLADAARALIANQEHPDSWKNSMEPVPPRSSWLSWLPQPNAVGRRAVRWMLSHVEGMPYEVARTDLERSFTAALIALECWKARHGTLPPTLDALVPEYLDAVPRDPYDGKPLRYSAEKKILYSVGGDGEDSGGSRSTDGEAAFQDGKEPTLRLEP